MYYRIFAHVESIEDSSYPRKEKVPGKKEKVEVTVAQFTFTMRVPQQTETIKVTVPFDKAGSDADRRRWEEKETMMYVLASTQRTVSGANDDSVWGFCSFNATDIREVKPEEEKELAAFKRAKLDAAAAKRAKDKAAKQAAEKAALKEAA